MFNKKMIFVLIFIILTACLISSVSAEDLNMTDDVASQDMIPDEKITIDENSDNTENENLTADESIENENPASTQEIEITNTDENESEITESENYEILNEPSEINAKITTISNVGEYKTGKAIFQLTDLNTGAPIANKLITLSVTGASFEELTDADGKVTYNFENLYTCYNNNGSSIVMDYIYPGTYSITVILNDNDEYKAQQLDTNLIVKKSDIAFAVTNVNDYYGTNKNFTVKVTNVATGDIRKNEIIKIYIQNTAEKYFYLSTGSSGIITIKVHKLLPGIYPYTINPNETSNINPVTANGKIIIKGKAKITLTQSGLYYKKLTVKVISSTTKKAMANQNVILTFSNGKKITLKTDSNGVATYNIAFKPGKYTAKATATHSYYTFNSQKITIKISKIPTALKVNKLSTTYKSGKYFKAKVINPQTKKAIRGLKVNLKIYTGKKAKTITLKTNSKGIVKYSSSKLDVGRHKVIVKIKKTKEYTTKTKTSLIKISKMPVIIKANKLSTTHKSGKYFKAKIINSKTKKAVKGVKITLKVYTGKQAKTINLKSNSKGIVKYSSASKLKIGKHKAIVKINSKNHKGKTVASSIFIDKQLVVIKPVKLSTKFNSGKYFKAKIVDKKTKKPVKGVGIILNVYTGKHVKTINLKSNSKGIVKYSSASKLSFGSHKVILKVKSKLYQGKSKTSYIKIIKPKSSGTTSKNRISTYIDQGSGLIFTFRYMAGQMVGGDGTFHLYAGNKELMNKKIKVYAGSEYLGTIKSGVEAFIPTKYGTITFKYAGSSKYKPCTYETTLFTQTYTPTYTPPTYTPPTYTPPGYTLPAYTPQTYF